MKCFPKKNKLESIVEQLRKYPFTEKMLLCQSYSTKLMELTHLNILNNTNVVYPWEIEVFAELSLFADGPKATFSFNNSDSKFSSIINEIRNYQHPYLKKQKNTDFANAFIMATGLQQFKSQENILDRLYRYEYFWNFINNEVDMKTTFSGFFDGLSYTEFRNLGILIFFYASLHHPTVAIIRALMLKHKKVVDFLSMTREEYKCMQSKKIEDNFENVIFGFNYLRPYPFIEYGHFLFLPLPYLVIDAVAESLLTRITNDNNLLREKIGKEVAQSYIEKIFKEGNVYDEVLPECIYSKGKNRIDSPDILIKKDNQACFIDTKLSTPKLEIRKFNTKEIDKTISKYAKNIVQVYNRVKDFNSGLYYPFKEQSSIDEKNVFGIVALLEDSYISRRLIYQEVFRQLKIKDDSETATYIKSNIKITSFRDLEMFAFRSYNIFIALTKKRNNPRSWNDIGLFDELLYKSVAHKLLPSVDCFEKTSRRVILDSIEEFSDMGIIKK